MPGYTIRIKTDVTLDRKGLDLLEDVVYDVLTETYGGSIELTHELIGITDVEAEFD